MVSPTTTPWDCPTCHQCMGCAECDECVDGEEEFCEQCECNYHCGRLCDDCKQEVCCNCCHLNIDGYTRCTSCEINLEELSPANDKFKQIISLLSVNDKELAKSVFDYCRDICNEPDIKKLRAMILEAGNEYKELAESLHDVTGDYDPEDANIGFALGDMEVDYRFTFEDEGYESLTIGDKTAEYYNRPDLSGIGNKKFYVQCKKFWPQYDSDTLVEIIKELLDELMPI